MTNFITHKNFKEFRMAFDKAMKERRETFIFKNKPILTVYAYYVVEYFESLPKKPDEETT